MRLSAQTPSAICKMSLSPEAWRAHLSQRKAAMSPEYRISARWLKSAFGKLAQIFFAQGKCRRIVIRVLSRERLQPCLRVAFSGFGGPPPSLLLSLSASTENFSASSGPSMLLIISSPSNQYFSALLAVKSLSSWYRPKRQSALLDIVVTTPQSPEVHSAQGPVDAECWSP